MPTKTNEGRLSLFRDGPEDQRIEAKAAAEGENPGKLILAGTATFSVEAKGEGDNSPPLRRFEMVANTGKVPMRLEGWRFPVVLDFSGGTIPNQTRPVRLNHDRNQGVGHTESVNFENGNLVARGVVSRDTPAARDVVVGSENGFPWQASVSTSADDVQFIKDGQSVAVNGAQFAGPLNVIRKWTLGEISFVDLGGDGQTTARVAANAKDGEDDATHDADADDGGVGATIARVKAERARKTAINAMVAEEMEQPGANVAEIEKISAEALEEGWSVQDTQIKLLRASRPRAPKLSRADLPAPKTLEAAFAMSCGVSDEVLAKDRDYGERVVEAAYPMRRIGIVGLIRAALEAAGQRIPHNNHDMYTLAVEQHRIAASAFSTVNLPGILGNVANKVLLQAFTTVDAIYPTVAEQADFSNFHVHTMYRLGVNGEFEPVPHQGEIKHASLSQESFTNQLGTYGKMLTLDRRDIINDDLNSFRSLAAQLARKARIAADKAVVNALLESSDTFYTSARGNRLTSNPLGVTELGVAEAAMLAMTDSDGDPIYAMPKYLLVPPALKPLGDSLFTSERVNETTTANKGRPVDNPYRNRFPVVSSPFLSLSTIDGYSATAWYLLADPATLPAVQIAYLNGRRAPFTETADAPFNTLGMSMRVVWDFGVAQMDYRGANKSTA